jgi:hypothetical protein
MAVRIAVEAIRAAGRALGMQQLGEGLGQGVAGFGENIGNGLRDGGAALGQRVDTGLRNVRPAPKTTLWVAFAVFCVTVIAAAGFAVVEYVKLKITPRHRRSSTVHANTHQERRFRKRSAKHKRAGKRRHRNVSAEETGSGSDDQTPTPMPAFVNATNDVLPRDARDEVAWPREPTKRGRKQGNAAR